MTFSGPGAKPALLAAKLASLRLTCAGLVALLLLMLAGAWVPQTTAEPEARLLERFGTEGFRLLQTLGLTDVFHSPAFLAVVGILTVNLVACTFARMAPRIRSKMAGAPFKTEAELEESCRVCRIESAEAAGDLIERIKSQMRERGFTVRQKERLLVAEKGRLGLFAAPVTHLGLMVLLTGVAVSALTGFDGLVEVSPGQIVDFPPAGDRKPRTGKVPDLRLKLVSTRQDSYADGQPKQWYSRIAVSDRQGRALGEAEASVNNPVTFAGIDIYQSQWGVKSLRLALAGQPVEIELKDFSGDRMGIYPLLPDLLLIAAVKDPSGPARLYLKKEQSASPLRLAAILPGETVRLGRLTIENRGAIVTSGLQYKYDPGLWIVYLSFLFFTAGAICVAAPCHCLWLAVADTGAGGCVVSAGYNANRFARIIEREIALLSGVVETRSSGEAVHR